MSEKLSNLNTILSSLSMATNDENERAGRESGARRRELAESISLEVRRSQNRTEVFDESVCAALGINRTDHRCMDILDQEGPMTAGQLAVRARLTSGAITTVLDRLERAGFARRVRDDHDRRRVQVELTDEARSAVWVYYEPLAAASARLYEGYSDGELELVLDFLRRAAALFVPLLEPPNEPGS